jgi:hypothetical protein
MRLVIITSCTGEKVASPKNPLTLADFRKGHTHVNCREQELKPFLNPAAKMYAGQQHVRLLRGISAFSNAHTARSSPCVKIDLSILSAGYGLIPGDREIAPYECTFAKMKANELITWGEALNIPAEFRRTLAQPYDLGLVLLGDDYLQACQIDQHIKFGGLTLLFCGKRHAAKIPRIPNLRVIILSNAEAKRFSCGLVGLKGELAARLLKKIAEQQDLVFKLRDPVIDVLALLDPGDAKPKASGKILSLNHKVDQVIELPNSWFDKPHRQKLKYFLPEWDDLVDPDFDFLEDKHSAGGGDWSNQVYAHQMFPEPNFDGLLVSRAVAEGSAKKKKRINELGVHRFLRIPSEVPVMGDCGAFDYISEKQPPYTTEELLDYYTRLGFDYGVSIDHLIVPAFESETDFRYNLTIENAQEFLKGHRQARLSWEPIGAVQGWDPPSYAEAALKYVRMGYRYLALGSLIPKKSKDILKIIAAVREKIPPEVRIHAFGVARLDSVEAFSRAGVQSVDSASYLRQAWMRLHQGYATMNGPYSALRIPAAGKSFRAKHMRNHAGLAEERILQMEEAALSAVRGLARRMCSVDNCLNALLEYDRFVTAERIDMTAAYRRTLEERPWENCDCAICRKWGVEVIIFRGNNRNRRRGFHNTYIFYRLLQRALHGENIPFVKSRNYAPTHLQLRDPVDALPAF